jgi:hypothetical protein
MFALAVTTLTGSGCRDRAMNPLVKREHGKVWIKGVPALRWGHGKDVTFIGSLEAGLAVTDRPYSYSDLMGYSGMAFRMRWFRGDTGQRGSTSCVVAEFPEEYLAIERATGWHIENKVEGLVGTFRDQCDMTRFAVDIVASIDAGMPVLTYPPHWNVAVVYGYENEGKKLLLRDYDKGDETLEIDTAELVPFLVFLEDKGKPLSPRDAFLEGLRVAVINWNREPLYNEYNGGRYFYGPAGFELWQEDVKFRAASAEEPKESGFGDSWTMDSLRDARSAGVAFLREHAGLLGEAGQAALERAAELYEQEAEMLRSENRETKNADEFCKYLEKLCAIESEVVAQIVKALDG